jgi:tripartite-type tricarboxylate transporter receptor subunit TctC
MLKRRDLLNAAIAATLCDAARSQSWPLKPVRLVVNFPPGGPGDVICRYLAQKLGPLLGHQVIVDNRAGGAGAVGILAAAHSAPDGYTFLYTATTGLVQVPLITKDASFNPMRSVIPVLGIGTTPIALLANSSLPANNFPGFIEWARQQKNGVDIGGGGPIIEVATAVLSKETGVKFVYVAYKGTSPVVQAALGGEITAFFSTPSPTISEFVKSGKLKVLGITSAQQSNLVPNAEPIARYVPNYVHDLTYGVFAPHGTPQEIRSKFAETLSQALSAPGEVEKFANFGLSLRLLTPAEVARAAERDSETIRKTLETTPVKFGE